MSDADSTSRRRPPTIDLTAKEVEPQVRIATGGGCRTGGECAGRCARARRQLIQRTAPYAIGVVIGAVGVAAIAAAFWYRIEQALQGPPRTDAALAGRVAAADAQAKALGDLLAALTRRVDELAAAAQSGLAEAKAAGTAADAAEDAAKDAAKNAAQSSTQTGVQHSDIEALEGRVAALQNAMKSLDANLAQCASSSNADDRVMRLAIAAEALRAAVERGAPLQDELAAVRALGADAKATAQLEPFAALGLTSTAELGRELSALTPALSRAMEPEPSSNSILAKLESRRKNSFASRRSAHRRRRRETTRRP